MKYQINFSGNQLPPSMRNSSKTDSKKKASLKQRQKSPEIMPLVAKIKKIDSNLLYKIQALISIHQINQKKGSIYTTQVMNLSGEVNNDFSP